MEKNYLLTTEDGTATLFLEEYGQAMHSVSGAYEESLLKHVYPSGILECSSEKVSALDIGFGLGYNVLALMNEFLNRKSGRALEIISLEKDRTFSEFMKSISFNDGRDEIYGFIKEVYNSGKGNYYQISLEIIFGDARETLQGLSGKKFNAVFQDPFSPSKNPELWSVDYFNILKNLLAGDGVITTYSSADHIRRAMLEAGLGVGRGPSVGKKREGTIAAHKGVIDEIDKSEIEKIISNIKSAPYKDRGLRLTRESILEERLLRIKKIKLESDDVIKFV